MQIFGNLVFLRDDKRDTDDEDFFRWLNLEEWQYYDEPDAPFNPVQRETFDARIKQSKKPIPGAYTWQVDTLEGIHVGWVLYYQMDENTKSAYVGICLPDPGTWGKGYGTDAIGLLTNHLLTEVGLLAVYITTWTGNLRMRRLAEKCGYKEIGRSPHRATVSIRGEPLEFIHYRILSDDTNSQ